MGKGKLPCDVIFIGEAPGESEDTWGKPFVGESGGLLADMIQDALVEETEDLRFAYSNMLACLPRKDDNGRRTPQKESLEACHPRLQEFVELAKPHAIVMIGKVCQRTVPKYLDYDFEHSMDLIHPSALLGLDNSQYALAVQRCVVSLRDFFLEVQEFLEKKNA